MLGTAVKTLPLGGRDISEFILRRLRERGEPVPSEAMMETVRFIKENLFYRHGGTTSRGQVGVTGGCETDVGDRRGLRAVPGS